jgi:hypothetical protein
VTEYTTKDSGQHEQYDSGMRRDTEAGKPRFDLIRTKRQPYDEQMITRYAHHLARGAAKYDPRNWEDGDSEVELDRAISSLLRHVEQLVAGETDEDHAAAVWFNAQAVEYFRWRIAQKSKQPLELTLSWDGSKNPEGFAMMVETASGFLYTPKAVPVEKNVDPVKKVDEILSDADSAAPPPTRQDFIHSSDEGFWKAAGVARKAHQDTINAWHNRPEYATVLPSAPVVQTKRRPDDWLKRFRIDLLAGDLGDTYAEVTQDEFFIRLNQPGNAWKQQSGVLDESDGLD